MAKIYQNRGGTLTPILDTDKFVNVENVNQTIAGTKTFTGSVSVPDQTVGDYSQKAANTKFVQDTVTNLISCREETYTAPAGGIPENTNITIPSSQKYIVGSKMLEVYYNGLIEYRGDQYDEVGTVNTESGTITIKHAMEEGDKLVFRINGLCDADSVSDAVHITGTETITGTKTFTVSPNVPTVTDISDSSTKIASTKFVHDLVDGFVTCVDEVLDITTAQASGSLVTLPQGLQYIVGSNALMVSYNGAVCHHGEQFNEYGTTGQLSNQIEILFDLSVGDQLGFRIQGLNRIDDFTDVVHQSGAETITGTKTFNVSPVLPEMAMSTNDRTAASTEFVHDMVDGFMMCYDEVLTVATAAVSGSNITLPSGMQYIVGSHMLMVSYNGTVCHEVDQFNEVGTTGQASSTIQVLFDLRVGDKLGFRIHGISNVTEVPSDAVHTTGTETISGTKTFNAIPVIPTTTPTTDGHAASKKYVDDEVAPCNNLIIRSGDSNTDDVAAAHNCIYRGKQLSYTNAELSEMMTNGDFSDLYIGDYVVRPFAFSYSGTLDGETITITVASTNFNFRIAHLNYWKNMGDTAFTKNHIVFVPDKALFSTKMRKTNVTTGGIPSSNVWTLLGNANPSASVSVYKSLTANTCFGSYVQKHRDWIPDSVNTSAPSAAGANFTGSTVYTSTMWRDVYVGLMHEPMVYGGTHFSSSGYDTGCGASELALFALDPTWRYGRSNRSTSWLCAVASSSYFARAGSNGGATSDGASASRGVRPYFLFS